MLDKRTGRAAVAAAIVFLLAGPSVAQNFPPKGDDLTTSLGSFRIYVMPGFRGLMTGYPGYNSVTHRLQSPTLYDPSTKVGRSGPHTHGSATDINGAVVGSKGTIVKDSSFLVLPPAFQGPPGTNEVHTEIVSLSLTGGGAAVRAGAKAPLRPISPGEVESQRGPTFPAFPAESFFDIYVEVDLPNVGGKTATLANNIPLMVKNPNLLKFPPRVVYIHGSSTAVPVVFLNSNPGKWSAGQLFGYLVLAGHGIGYRNTSQDRALFERYMQMQKEIPLPPAASAQHNAVYLIGGHQTSSTSTLYLRGVNRLDARVSPPTTNLVALPSFRSSGFCMDYDNKNLVVAVQGTTSTYYGKHRSALYRYDPTGNLIKTLYQGAISTMGSESLYHVVVDHNGDYIANVYRYSRSPYSSNYYLWKIDQAGNVNTLATTIALGRRGYWYGKTVTNIDSGKLLVSDGYGQRTPTTIYYPVLEVDTDTGAVNTWNRSRYGWYGYYNMPQNHRNGFLEGVYGRYVYQLRPGSAARTTLATLVSPYPYAAGDLDLQTAARRRQVYSYYGYTSTRKRTGLLFYYDTRSWTATSIAHSPGLYCWGYDFDFYQGRHTQTVQRGKQQWQVRFSAPRFPGHAYVAVCGLSGVRPGLPLMDGRRVNLNWDVIVFMTLNNLIPSIWNGGSGMLDGNGEAHGMLDLSGFPRFNVPLWIAWIVLDPSAPSGVAYAPDTYVMRI